MTLLILSTCATLACLAGLLLLRARLRRSGLPENEIGRRALATPVGLVCFWGALLGGAVTITAAAALVAFP